MPLSPLKGGFVEKMSLQTRSKSIPLLRGDKGIRVKLMENRDNIICPVRDIIFIARQFIGGYK
jgi:hypothetical protein